MKYERISTHGRVELSGLADLNRPPRELYYQGIWNEDLFSNCVAVIGSRKMSKLGKLTIERLIPKLVAEGKTIVSGFMYGVDQCAHEKVLDCRGRTIAVLGFGINWARCRRDRDLSARVVDSGSLVISEWEDQAPARWTFPLRNRIVAALASEIYVVEAAIGSGTMITATIGKRLSRPIHFLSEPGLNR